MDGFKCIAKEAELISEWLRRERRIFTNDEYTALCHDIRVVAAQLFISRWKWSVHIAAALRVRACRPSPNHIPVHFSEVYVTWLWSIYLRHQGIRKEAEWLIENSKCNSDESISTSMKIRQFALRFVRKKLGELEPYKNESSESEMASERWWCRWKRRYNYMVRCMFWKICSWFLLNGNINLMLQLTNMYGFGFLPGGLLWWKLLETLSLNACQGDCYDEDCLKLYC